MFDTLATLLRCLPV